VAGPLPHSKQVQQMAETFLADFRQEIEAAEVVLRKSTEFRNTFRTSLATDAVLSKDSAEQLGVFQQDFSIAAK
jgi:hypothetical protein